MGTFAAMTGMWAAIPILAQAAVIAWLSAMIALPLIRQVWGEQAIRWGTTAGVLFQDAAVLIVLGTAWGWSKTALVAAAVAAMGWGIEFLGSHTGIPFGRYHYTDRLQPQLGRVPLLIPLAWLMMLPPSWAIADLIAGNHKLAFILVSALAMTAWDFFLDPQMVDWGFWAWENPGGYCLKCASGGIPWTNFVGWALASGLMTTILNPGNLPTTSLVLIYALTWILETIGLGMFWKQPYPALIGFVSMGGMLAWAWL
ncbi:MAG: carotenoid biosynthesis protein [Anaerolineae bacterium]|nr:carotenoid biosynthesis protein [Anaerolineae bacterium]